MINPQDIKKGTCVRLDGKLYFCIDLFRVKPDEGNTIIRTTLRDVVEGGQIECRFNISEKLEDVRIERRPYQFTCTEGEHYHFMNQETFDGVIIDKNLINGIDPMKEGEIVDVVSDVSTDTVLFTDMPTKVQLKVTYTEPDIKGDIATNTLRPAAVKIGVEVHAPLSINKGEVIEISTTDGSYVDHIRE